MAAIRWWMSFAILLTSTQAFAQRAGGPSARAPTATVVLQLGSLRVPSGLHRGAVMHAIARDAWPSLTQCVQSPPEGRGFTDVELRRSGRSVSVRVSGGPVANDPTLRTCVTTALGRITLPPIENEETPARVLFQLAFNVPPLAG